MNKTVLFVVILLFLMCGTTMAEPSGFGIALGYGRANGKANLETDIYRAGLKKDFTAKWLEHGCGYFSGYFELSYNRWECKGQYINAVGISPVFAYHFGNQSNAIIPYIEAGIGIAYLDEYRIAYRNLGSHWQFEDRVGLGARIGFVDLNLRYLHYSNANLESPNDGIDILMFTVAFQF